MDYNNDGKRDLIAGDTQGNVWVFLNIGTKAEPKLAEGKKVEADGKPIARGSSPLAGSYSKLHMADWDGDGLMDILVGHSSTIILYRNTGTRSAPRFQAPVPIQTPEGKFPVRPSPFV
ncbi:MAG: VCBS repeat-containing protein, partial [Phycisphaerae bacterium]